MKYTSGSLRLLGIAMFTTVLPGCSDGIAPSPSLPELARPMTVEERALVASTSDFAFDLLREITETRDGNTTVAPLSVSMAMGMVMAGAGSETRQEIRDALGYGGAADSVVNASYRGLLDLLGDLDPAVRVDLANAVWYHPSFPFHESFLTSVRSTFDASVMPLDFSDPAAPSAVNAWVRQATSGRIDKLIEAMRQDEVMFLANAIYFDAPWKTRFDPNRTYDAEFQLAGGGTRTVRMMSREGSILHGSSPTETVVELPYGNGAYAMTLLLPTPGRTTDDLIDDLSADGLARIQESMVESRVTVELPKFEIRQEGLINEALQALGIRHAFFGADFSGMSPRGGDLVLTRVVHATRVTVDEEGTEAAAATGAGIGVVSLPAAIRFDRPFVALIRERLTGTVLFAMRVSDPSL